MKKILVIEDDFVLLDNIADFLKQEGFDVHTAKDGTDGIQAAIDVLPDLIISDIDMPRKDGYEVCRTLQTIPSTSTIPFIFLTAKSQKEELRRGMQLGADDFLTKPFELDELLKSIRLRIEKHDRHIKQSDDRFYALIDNPVIGVYIYCGNKFIFTNSKLSEIIGYSRKELELMSFDDLAEANENDDAFEKIQRCIKGIQNSVHVNMKITKNDQTQIIIEIFGTLIMLNGNECLMGNISEVKQGKYIELLPGKNTDKTKLSNREIEVLQLICKGFSSAEICEKLFVSQRTIDSHRANLIEKTESRNTADLVMYAIRNGLVEI